MPHSFFDTNVLFYASDDSDTTKRDRAQEIIAEACSNGDGFISVPVLGEFFTAIVLGKNRKLNADEAEKYIESYAAALQIVPVEFDLVPKAIALHRRYQTSYFDSLHIAAAIQQGCQQIWSEDLADGQTYDGVQVVNPFKGL